MSTSRLSVAAHNVWRFSRAVAHRFLEDRCTRVASSLAFTTVLALVPLTAVSFAMFSVFPVFQNWLSTVQTFVYSNFAPALGDVAIRYLQQFAANAGKLTLVGLVFLVATAIMLMSTIEDTFNDIWRVSSRRRWTHRVFAYWTIITLGPLLLGLSLSMTSYLVSLSKVTSMKQSYAVLLMVAPLLFEWLMFVVLYVAAPNCVVRIKDAMTGAAVATVLFEIAKRGFVGYAGSTTTYQAIYGAVAALPVFLIWIHLSWVITLLGAEVTAAFSERRPAPGSGTPIRKTVKRAKAETENAQTRT